jgi:hypothetical protein
MTDFVSIKCVRCEERFGMTEERYNVAKRTEQTFHCPNGHPQHFPLGPTKAEKLEKELQAERRARQRAEQNVAYEAQQATLAKRTAAAYKGQTTKLRKRIGAGTCPCCKRTVSQLARHMASKHPEFTPEPPAPTLN